MIHQKSTKIVYENSWIRLHEDEVEFSDGSNGVYAFSERCDAGPMIIPVTEKGKLVILREWRYPIKDWTYSFPFGGVMPGEDNFTAAKRELKEETGYSASEWKSLGIIKIDPGQNAQITPIFLATGLLKGSIHQDSSEVHQVMEFTPDEINEKIKNGEMDNGWLLAGFVKYLGTIVS